MTEESLKDLMSQMTLREKIGQLVQLAGDCFGAGEMAVGPQQKLGITQETVDTCGSVLNVLGAENVRRIQDQYLERSRLKIPLLFMADVIYGYQTVYPIPLGLGASWNPDLIREDYKLIAEEAAADGDMVTFSPPVDIVRDVGADALKVREKIHISYPVLQKQWWKDSRIAGSPAEVSPPV